VARGLLGGLLVLLLLCGCNDGSKGDDQSETAVSARITISPADGSADNSVLSSITWQLPPEIDTVSVSGAAVTLTFQEKAARSGEVNNTHNHSDVAPGTCLTCHHDPLPDQTAMTGIPAVLLWNYLVVPAPMNLNGTMNYNEATRLVTFIPDRPLRYAGRYQATLSGLRLPDGNEVGPVQTVFTTVRNALTTADRQAVFGQPGTGKVRHDYPEQGNSRHVYLQAAGADGAWFTADDEPDHYLEDILLADGRHQRIMHYDAPGNDGQWFTADDHLSGYGRFEFVDGRLSRIVYYQGPGGDKAWLTDDDQVLAYDLLRRDAAGHLTTKVTMSDAGYDGAWFTADDGGFSSYTFSSYDAAGRLQQTTTFSDSGADGLWFTDDDIQSRALEFRYDSGQSELAIDHIAGYTDGIFGYTRSFLVNGRLVRQLIYRSAGIDGVWFNDDDGISSYNRYSYLANGALDDIVAYGGAGNDGVWDTADDRVYNIFRTEYTERGQVWRETNWRAGDDALAATADDQVHNYEEYFYNDAGELELHTDVSGPGANGIWFDDDDEIKARNSYVTGVVR